MDGFKDVIFISLADGSNGRIPHTKFQNKGKYLFQGIRVGNQFWIVGGKNNFSHISLDVVNFQDEREPYKEPFQDTTIWNTRKQTYYPGPLLNQNLVEFSLITLNRSHVLGIFASGTAMSHTVLVIVDPS